VDLHPHHPCEEQLTFLVQNQLSGAAGLHGSSKTSLTMLGLST